MPSITLAYTTLPITNVECGSGAASALERELLRVNGVVRVHVNTLTEMAYVEYDAGLCSHAQLTAALQRAGHGENTP